MLVTVVIGLVGLGVGFGAGRVKNAAKLAAIEAEVAKVENSAVTEVKTLVAAIKAKL